MPQSINFKSDLKSEIQEVYKACTNEENKDIAVAIATELQKADNFNMIKAWIQKTLPKSNENKMQRKVIDILCNVNILNELSNNTKNFVKQISVKSQKIERTAAEENNYFNDIKDKLDKLIDKTQILHRLLNNSSTVKMEAGVDYIIYENFPMNAKSLILLVTVILVVHYQNGML